MNRRVWPAFALLCVLAGSRWIVATWFPGDLPLLLEQGLHELAIGIALGIASRYIGPRKSSPAPRETLQIAACGLLLIALPSLLSYFASGGVSSLSALALLTLTPAATALIVAQQTDRFGASDSARSLLLPALAAAGGAFLLLQVAVPSSVLGRLWLAALGASVLAVAFAAVRLHRLLQTVPLPQSIAAISLACAAVTLSFALAASPSLFAAIPLTSQTILREALFCLLIDAPLAWLSLWLLRALDPVRYTTRYLFVPLISVVEGILIMRPGFTATMAAGTLLMLSGAAVLLRTAHRESADGLKLR